MSTRKWTGAVLLSALLLVFGWDLIVAIRLNWNATASALIFDISAHRMIPFSVGVVIGHLFWPIERTA